MAKILSVVSRASLARLVDPVAAALLRAGVTPNAVTVAGTIGVLVGALGFATRGHFIIALVIITLSCLTDMIDGAMARQRGITNKFGAFLDSSMDRVADGAIFGSIAYWYATQGQPRVVAAALLCLLTGQVVSYVKARAEGLGMTANVGLIERAERLIGIGIGGVLWGFGVPYGLEIVMWVLGALSIVTIGQRMAEVYRQAYAR
ncbi:CDP-alcohol phosphatidyltransferase family protein [Dactylosporangium sp. AC04546]|uniref:phosphatidylinositol phosphate synthase n=1 Tax=Dactylosporangium sp. AC04546 TaxID=2862460 RepID=UPI001EDE24E7|nr:CDP-alcohol phosphatidyltransferase family protein [Dactylosporangium sp. AC04546]WVK81742.1 CDP-alcohol phosphatidyltransferase family protein [Dactylosporangium sp. AC04546]